MAIAKTVTVLGRRMVVPRIFADELEDGETIGDVVEVVPEPATPPRYTIELDRVHREMEQPRRRFIAPWD